MNEYGGGCFSKRLYFLVFLGLLSVVSSQNFDSQRGYLILAPAVFRSGVDQTITVRIFDQSEPVLVKATIVDWRDLSIFDSKTASVQGDGKITLQVPKGVEGKATLQICGNCHEHSTFRFQNSTTITIINKGTSAFVQTDKPIYKPSQKVHINVFTVDRDLRPISDNVTVYAKAPNDVKIIEWRDLRPTCSGTIAVSFPLSDQPPLGEWKIFAELQGNSYNITFEVDKYVLPKFDVTIVPPASFQDFSQCEEAVVSSIYTFGKPVRGTLEVNMTVTGIGYFTRDLNNGITTRQTMPFNGEERFSICIQDNLGRTSLTKHFRGNLGIWATVISEDGSRFSAYDDTTIVSRTFVDLEFTAETRKYFKHGMPFRGQIFASYLNGAAAKDILIELKAEDSREPFLTRELLSSSDGIVSFFIPALPQSTKYLWLEARVIAIDGTFTDRHQYLAVYHQLHSWHSPSECHLLIEEPDEKLEVNMPSTLSVMSTCSCEFTLYYEILSRGDILVSSSLYVNTTNSHQLEFSRSAEEGTHICKTTITMTPSANMAPLAKLLAYYVRPNGEGVADSIHLPIAPVLENSVSIDIPKKDLSPGENIIATVRADEGSCVCLGATDKSLHFISPEYLLSKEEIFDEIFSYDMNNLPFEEERRRPSTFRTRRSRWRRSLHGGELKSRDSFHAFMESGLVVMTNIVVLKHEQSFRVFSEIRRQAFTQSPAPKFRTRKPRKLRSFFPETWYWNCLNVNQGGENSITLQVPDSVTSWVVSAVGTSPSSGIGIAKNIEVTTSKPFFVEFNMPYSAIRGEEMDLPITAHNYLDTCAQVRLAVATPPEVTFPDAGSDVRRVVKHLCIEAGNTVTTTFRIAFSNLGISKVLAVADAFQGPNLCCSADHKLLSETREVVGTDEILERDPVGVDALIRTILVEPEGEPREYTHSVFFCPNERMNITTPPSTFHYVKFTRKDNNFNFLTRASSSVHVALTAGREKTDSLYEIILGGRENTLSWIQSNGEILATAKTGGVLSNNEFRAFWIHWTDSNITVGHGMENTVASEFLQIQIPQSIDARYVGLATSSQTAAEFRLWSTEELGDGFSEVFQLDVPNYAIPGSVRGKATIIGDVMGPTLRNLNNLLKLPYGCGEQNMINFAPNIHILKYLRTTNQLTSEVRKQAREYLVEGYQRQLTYRRQSGSYSAFGDRDEFGSMWLTAFVMKSYAESQDFIYIDQPEIDRAMQWILNHQLEDGSFPPYGKIMNKDVQGGINRNIALTAYVVIALLETRAADQDSNESIEKAVTYLEGMLYVYDDPYAAALLAYALTLADSTFAPEARMILSDMAVTTGSGSYRHWSLKSHVERPFNPNDLFAILSSSSKQTIASAEIELASYALLAFTKSEDVSSSLPIVRWISQQRNSQGGFSSTQDTCAALQALSSYATFAYIGGVNLNITLEGPSNYVWNVVLNDTNSEILQSGGIPALSSTPIPVFVKANGDGCALLQINVQFNIPEPEDKKDFDLKVSVAKDLTTFRSSRSGLKRKRESGEPIQPIIIDPEAAIEAYQPEENINPVDSTISYMRICGRWKNHGSSNMAVLEVPLLTGFTVDVESLNMALSNKLGSLKRFEVEKSNIIFYFDEISSLCKTCVTFKTICESLVTNLSPRIVKLYDYYEPGYESSVAYNTRGQIEAGLFPIGPIEADDGYPECKCYRECGYKGPTVCGDDGNVYPNICRMQVKSCETGRELLQQDDTLCEQSEEETTLEPPIIEPHDLDNFYADFLENSEGFPDLFGIEN